MRSCGVEWTIALGALVGAIYGAGERGLIPAWGAAKHPAWLKLIGAAWAGWVIAVTAGSGTLAQALAAIGAAKLAELAISAGIDLVRVARE